MAVARNFDSNTARTPAFFDADTWFYGWKNSEALPDDKDFKVKYNDLYTAIRSGLASTAGLTNGSVLFAQSSAIAQDNANLFWDDTLNRLGVGTNAPASEFHLRGVITQRASFGDASCVLFNTPGSVSVGINKVVSLNNFAGYGGLGNVFIANNNFSDGNHSASNSIQIGGSGQAKQNSVVLLADIANFMTDTVAIGYATSVAGSSFIQNTPTTVVGANINGVNPNALASMSGAIVFGYSNNVTSSPNESGFVKKSIVIGANNVIYQNHTGIVSPYIEKLVIGHSITDTQMSVLKNSFGVGIGAYSFIHDLTNNNELYGGLLLTNAGYDQSSTNTKYLKNGTAPTTLIADTHAYYSADITPGNAAPHFRTGAGNIIRLYSETTSVTAAAFVSNTSGIVDDSATFGGYTIGQIVAALKNHKLLL